MNKNRRCCIVAEYGIFNFKPVACCNFSSASPSIFTTTSNAQRFKFSMSFPNKYACLLFPKDQHILTKTEKGSSLPTQLLNSSLSIHRIHSFGILLSLRKFNKLTIPAFFSEYPTFRPNCAAIKDIDAPPPNTSKKYFAFGFRCTIANIRE